MASVTHTAALARLGHALADPTRTRVLLALREAPAYPSDLAEALGVSRQVMSNQLACLRGCGLAAYVTVTSVLAHNGQLDNDRLRNMSVRSHDSLECTG